MTTEEFIQKAKAIHGDKYDYSKVEYVNSKTKVRIICPIHGEFWQVPSNHLRNHGCPKCAAAHVSEQISIWTRNTCYEEAKKYTSRGNFKEGCPYGYSSARKHGWLEDYTWFKPARKQVSVGYWTYERCYEEAQKYSSLKEFGEHANGALQYASKMSWLKDYTWFEKPFRWTKELVEKEARKYTSKYDFYNGSKNAYGAAVKYGWLDAFDWFAEIKKPNGYWTKTKCREEALKYTTKKEFLEGCPSAHAAAAKHGWLDEFVWLIDNRIDIIKDKIDSVYVYIFEDTKAAYVGRTLMRRQKKRDNEHIFNQDSDSVARYAKKHHIPVPPMTILESNLTLEEGQAREDYWRRWYSEQGYTMLNRIATGIGKGSLGAIGQGKWNRRTCKEEALKYKSSSEFETGSSGAYAAALRNGWLKDYIWFAVLQQEWDEQTCYIEARKYKTRGEFSKGCNGAYVKALKTGWINDYTWLSSRKQKPQGYWDNYDHCYEEAKKYTSRKSFEDHCKGGYLKAVKHGWIDDYIWFSEKQKHNYWNKETCYGEAKKYRTATKFAKNAVRAYQLARKNDWLKDYTWFEKPFRWTKELCKKEAKKYNKRGLFKKNCPGAYTKARTSGWLDEFFPPQKRK